MGRSINGWTSPVRWGIRQGRARSPGWKAWVVALGLVSGCGPREARYEAQLLTKACSGTPTLDGVRYLRFRVTGAGMEPVERYVPVDQGAAEPPAFPAGKGRVMEVRGYTDLPRAGGRVVALGRSLAFDVPESADAARPTVRITMRRVGEFVRPGAEGACVSLTHSRAGHTATLLEDGRVLLAGGFQVGSNGVRTTLSSVTLFDPVTGTLKEAPALESPRAFHTATRLPDGKVLLAGGEVESMEGPLPVGNALVLDVTQGSSSKVELKAARGHHAAAADSGGRVLLVGGLGVGNSVVSEAEGYDPATGQVFPVSTPVPRVGMGVMPVREGQRIAVVGGSDGTALRPEVLFFTYQGGTFVPVGEGARLMQPRRDASLVPFGGPDRLLLVGGHDTPGPIMEGSRVLASSEVVSSDEPSRVSAGPQVFARSELCAVALPDGRVMTLGGLYASWNISESDSHVEMLFPPGQDGSAPTMLGLTPLEQRRRQHTCTVLDDGSVLVVGGLDDDGSQRSTLGDLVIYTPVPLD